MVESDAGTPVKPLIDSPEPKPAWGEGDFTTILKDLFWPPNWLKISNWTARRHAFIAAQLVVRPDCVSAWESNPARAAVAQVMSEEVRDEFG